jgi:hypothetical protein
LPSEIKEAESTQKPFNQPDRRSYQMLLKSNNRQPIDYEISDRYHLTIKN